MSNVLIIDVGSQSIRALIFDEKGNMLAKEKVGYPEFIRQKPEYVEIESETIWQLLCQATKQLADNNPQLMQSIIAMSVDTFRDTSVLLDKDCVPVRPIIMWSDQRTAETSSQKLPFKQRFAFRLVGMTNVIDAIRQKTKPRWVQLNEPQTWAKVSKIVQVSGYINYMLTGNLIDCDASTIGHIPYDQKTRKWHTKRTLLYPIYNIPLEMMSPICQPRDVMGTIGKEVSALTGIPQGTKVIASGSDKGCETLGNGVFDENTASISFGTAATVQFATQHYFEPEPFLPSYPAVVRGYYNPDVQIFRGYWMVNWFKQNFAQDIVAKADSMGILAEQILDEEIAKIPAGCDGLVLQPFWQGGLSSPEARGAMVGFTDYHTRYHLYRAIIEGINFALREGLERMERRGKQKIDSIVVSGGGAQSDVICQIASDVFNKPVRRVQTYETSGLGAAIVTFVACGVYDDEKQAVKQMVRTKDEFVPNPDNVKVYDDLFYNVYMKMYKRLKPFYSHIYNKK